MLTKRATKLGTFGPVLLAVAGLLVVAVLQATPASSDSGGASTGGLPDAGVLRLKLGATDEFRFQVPAVSPSGHYIDTSPATTQSVGVSAGCRLSLGAGNLAELTSNVGTVGFVGDAIGVRGPGEGGGQPCGRVDAPSQLLAMRLGSGLSGKAIDFAEIDIEGKFNAVLQVKGYFLGAGETCSSPPDEKLMKSEQYDLTAGSDSGPDSGDLDNYRLRFPKNVEDADGNLVAVNTAVNCLTFNAISGGVSLEGGSDGTDACDALDGCIEPSLGDTIDDTTAGASTFTTDSLFHLIETDGVLACGGTATLTEAGITSFVERQTTNADGNPCTPIPYDQSSSTVTGVCNPEGGSSFSQCTFFRKDLFGQVPQFFWTVTWNPAADTYQPHNTQFDFSDGRGFVDAQLCLADTNGDGFPELPPSAPPAPPGSFDPWCVVETHSTLDIDTGLLSTTERYFGIGDPGSRKT